MEEKRNKIDFSCIDVMKFFMAICVIAIHTRPFVEIDNKLFQALYEVVVRTAVPFFFISTGYLLFIKLEYPYNNRASINKVKSELLKTVKMYGIWTVIYMPITVLDYCTNGKSLSYNLYHFFQGLVFIGEHQNSWPLWYLLSACYGLIIIYCLMKWKMKPTNIFMIAFLIYLLADVMDVLVANIGYMPEAINSILQVYIKTFLKSRITQGVFFISCGMMLGSKKICLSKLHFVIFAFGAGIYAFCPIDFFKPFGLAMYASVFFLFVIERFGQKKYKYAFFCRAASKVMYFMHMIFYTLYVAVVYHEFEYFGMDVFVVTLLMSLLASIIYFGGKKIIVKK